MHRDRRGLENIHTFFHIPEDLNSINIKSYEALKVYRGYSVTGTDGFNPLNAELIPTCHFLALVGAHHILHVSRIRVKPL